MRLAAGHRVGPYEILAPLGAGGMGEVYRALDTRLGREVAVKALPAERLADESRRRRFVQEARAASALNHPNIVAIHEIESSNGIDFIVMEYVPGQTLDGLRPGKSRRSHPPPGRKTRRLRSADTLARRAEGLEAGQPPQHAAPAFVGRRFNSLSVSVYRIEAPALVQCHTEHYAGSKLEPKGRPDLDLDGLAGAVLPMPLRDWPFAASAAAHCEIHCNTDQEVIELAGQVLAGRAGRERNVTKDDMRAYVREAVAKGDPEWIAFFASPAAKDSWRALAGMA